MERQWTMDNGQWTIDNYPLYACCWGAGAVDFITEDGYIQVPPFRGAVAKGALWSQDRLRKNFIGRHQPSL